MRTRGALRAKALGRLNALVAETGGATAVEFAMLAIPFVTMIFCLMELAVIFMISLTLDDAAAQASREIRTGQLQTAGGATQASFAAKICSHMAWIQSTCNANLSVDVETYPSFAAVNPPNPINNKMFSTTNKKFVPGGPQDIVVVRAGGRGGRSAPGRARAGGGRGDGQA